MLIACFLILFCLIGIIMRLRVKEDKPPTPDVPMDPDEVMVNAREEYTKPPAHVPAFIPPPTYVTSTIVNNLEHLPTFTYKPLTAPAYRPPPPYPGRKISEAPICTTATGVVLPTYKPPPTFTRAMTKSSPGRPDAGQMNSAPAYMPPPQHF